MADKKYIKISLGTAVCICIIIVLIIALGIVYYMGFIKEESGKNNIDIVETISESQVDVQKESKENVNEQEEKIEDTLEKTKNNITFSSLSGIYIGNINVESGIGPVEETEVSLYLFENGSYIYNNIPGYGYLINGEPGGACDIGYYTFNDDSVILHNIVDCGNDIGRWIISDTMILKINSDNSVTDNKSNVTLKKSSNKVEKEYDVISTELKKSINSNSLYIPENR